MRASDWSDYGVHKACGMRGGLAHTLAAKLPIELASLVVAHVAAMTLQGCVRGRLARRLLAAARQERAREWRERQQACVEAFLSSLAFGSKRPLPNALAAWEGGGRGWWERYESSKLRRLEAIG